MLRVNCKFRTEKNKLLLFNGQDVCFSNLIGKEILELINENENFSKEECINCFLRKFEFQNEKQYVNAKEEVLNYLEELISKNMLIVRLNYENTK